jgi:hypothetical protein
MHALLASFSDVKKSKTRPVLLTPVWHALTVSLVLVTRRDVPYVCRWHRCGTDRVKISLGVLEKVQNDDIICGQRENRSMEKFILNNSHGTSWRGKKVPSLTWIRQKVPTPDSKFVPNNISNNTLPPPSQKLESCNILMTSNYLWCWRSLSRYWSW